MHVPIHNHSEYSALDGLSTIDEIVARCLDLGCPCCGLTDHGTVAGHLELDKKLRAADIKPIFGCEVYHGLKPIGYDSWDRNERDAAHLVVGALNDKGLRNLWALLDEAAPNFRWHSRVTWDMLRKRSEGLFATSACIAGLVAQEILKEGDPYQPLNQYLDIFRDDFYIEIHTYPGEEQKLVNLTKVQFAEERGLPLLYADDAHFARPDQYDLHDMYLARQTKQSIYTPIEERKMWHPKVLYIKSKQEIRDALSYLPEWAIDDAINNSVVLGERCDASLPETKRHLPIFVPKESQWVERDETLDVHLQPSALLRELVHRGVRERYGDNPNQEVLDRAERELKVFIDAGLEHYFLMAWDLVQYCLANDIEIGPGRGSAAGCLIAFVLRITDVDPLPYNLIFERFFNAGREDGFPDIDMDFPRAKRRDILHYLEDRWGYNRVRSIGTITRMKPKAVVEKTYAACGATAAEAKELKKILDEIPDLEIHGPDSIGWAKETEPGKTIYVMEHVGQDIVDWVESKPEHRQDVLVDWLYYLQHLCSRAAGVGIHPSGIVVSDVDLPDELPCRWNKDEQLRVTMFPMDDVDKRKFIKMDVLGLTMLDILTDWRDQIREKVDNNFTWSQLEWNEFPEEMYSAFFDAGRTIGIFQVEEKYAVRELVKKFKPRSVKDLSIIVALNRPGPLRAAKGETESTADKFVKRKNGEQEVTYPHPFLEDILGETYGLFLYQEQVIQFFNKMGYSLSDSDAVRKILGKKKPEEMAKLKNGDGEWKGKGFMQIAPEFVGKEAEKIWNTIVGFASYSFNKSHSVAYGTICFRSAFGKFFGTAEYEMACVRNDEDDRTGLHIAEARKFQIEVQPPDMLMSMDTITMDDEGNLVYGFANIKGIKAEAAQFILELRDKYGDLICTREGLEDCLAAEKELWKKRQKEAKDNLKSFSEKSPNMKLKSNQIDALEAAGAFDSYTDGRMVTLQQKQELERELLGVVLTDDSQQAFANNEEKIAELVDSDYNELNELWDGEDMRYTVAGVITKIRATETRKDGKPMGIATIEYEGRETEFVIFPQQWRGYKFLWKEHLAGIFTLRKTKRGLNFDEGIKLSA